MISLESLWLERRALLRDIYLYVFPGTLAQAVSATDWAAMTFVWIVPTSVVPSGAIQSWAWGSCNGKKTGSAIRRFPRALGEGGEKNLTARQTMASLGENRPGHKKEAAPTILRFNLPFSTTAEVRRLFLASR